MLLELLAVFSQKLALCPLPARIATQKGTVRLANSKETVPSLFYLF
jgi:hypothetical protein